MPAGLSTMAQSLSEPPFHKSPIQNLPGLLLVLTHTTLQSKLAKRRQAAEYLMTGPLLLCHLDTSEASHLVPGSRTVLLERPGALETLLIASKKQVHTKGLLAGGRCGNIAGPTDLPDWGC